MSVKSDEKILNDMIDELENIHLRLERSQQHIQENIIHELEDFCVRLEESKRHIEIIEIQYLKNNYPSEIKHAA